MKILNNKRGIFFLIVPLLIGYLILSLIFAGLGTNQLISRNEQIKQQVADGTRPVEDLDRAIMKPINILFSAVFTKGLLFPFQFMLDRPFMCSYVSVQSDFWINECVNIQIF